MRIYLVRHAQSEANAKNIDFNGKADFDLTLLGEKQAESLAKFFSNKHIDIIYSSVLKRAIKTAEIIGKYCATKIKRSKLLNEANFGIFEGFTRKEVQKKFPRIFEEREKNKYLYRIPSGESYKDIGIRIKKFFNQLDKKSKQNIVIVTHVTVIKVILFELLHKPIKKIEKIYYPNTSITLITYNKKTDSYSLRYLNYYQHLRMLKEKENLNFFNSSIKASIPNYIEYKNSTIKVNSPPQILNIEITSWCNLSCPMCVPRQSRENGFISTTLFEKILKENRECFPHQFVWLHFNGEPLIHPQLFQIIRITKKYGIRACLSTNAVLLNSEKAKQIITSGLDYIVFSFDGVNKNVYEKLRKGAKFKTVKNNILNFLKIKQQLKASNPITQIQIIKMPETEKEIKKFLKEWRKTTVDIVSIKQFSTRAGYIVDKSLIDYKNGYHKISEQRKPCFWFWKGLVILWDGRVVPCCQDLTGKLILGDINEEPVKKIWNNLLMQKLRKGQLQGNYKNGLCDFCYEWEDKPTFSYKIHKFK